MKLRPVWAMAAALLTVAAGPVAAQTTPLTDQAFTLITIVGDVDANKSLGWL